VLTSWPRALALEVFVAVPAAVASYHLLEHPFRLSINRRVDRDSLAAGAELLGVCAVALVPYNAAGAATLTTAQSVAPVRPLQATMATNFVPSNVTPTLSEAHTPKNLRKFAVCRGPADDCVAGDTTATQTIVLFGDSHARHWIVAFDAMGKRNGWRIELLGRPACRSFVEPPSRYGTDCAAFRARANARIRELHPALVVFSNQAVAYFRGDRAAWARGVRAALDALPADVPAAVLSETPGAPADVPVCLAEHLHDARACEPAPHNRVREALNGKLRAIAGGQRATYVDLIGWFCAPARCPVIMNNVLVYRDINHLTVEFTLQQADAMGDALRPLLRGVATA
jgi:hypothetical protein